MLFVYLIHKTSLKSHQAAQSYTFLLLFIDCPHTKIVTWVHDTEIHNEKSYFKKMTLQHNAPKCLGTPGNVLWVNCIEGIPT